MRCRGSVAFLSLAILSYTNTLQKYILSESIRELLVKPGVPLLFYDMEAHNMIAAAPKPNVSDPSPPATIDSHASRINLLVTVGIVVGTLMCVLILFAVLIGVYRRDLTRSMASKPDEEVASDGLPPPYESHTQSNTVPTEIAVPKSEKVSLV